MLPGALRPGTRRHPDPWSLRAPPRPARPAGLIARRSSPDCVRTEPEDRRPAFTPGVTPAHRHDPAPVPPSLLQRGPRPPRSRPRLSSVGSPHTHITALAGGQRWVGGAELLRGAGLGQAVVMATQSLGPRGRGEAIQGQVGVEEAAGGGGAQSVVSMGGWPGYGEGQAPAPAGPRSLLPGALGGGPEGAGFGHPQLQEGRLVVRTGQQGHVVLGGRGRSVRQPPLAPPPPAPLDAPTLVPCLTSSTPSASTSRAQVPGFSTKGSPKPLWGTVTKAGSVLGGKTTGWLCSVPGVGVRLWPQPSAGSPPVPARGRAGAGGPR